MRISGLQFEAAAGKIDSLKKQKKNKEISEDDLFKFQDDAQKQTDEFIKKIDTILAEKEKEVMEV